MRESTIPAFSGNIANFAVPVLLGGLIALAIVAAGYPVILVITAGAVISVWSILSSQFGISLLLVVSALFSRAELFSFSLPFFGGGIKPTDVLLISIMSGWLLRWFLKMRHPRLPRRMAVIVLAFIAWAAAGVAIGVANGAFYKHSLVEFRPLLLFLLVFPIASEFSAKDVEKIIIVLLAVSVADSAKGIYLYSQGIGEQALYSEGNICVTSIEFLYLVTSALAAIGLLLRRKGPAGIVLGVFYLNCAALAVTYQRAAWLALMVSILIIIIANRDVRRGIILSGVLIISGVVAITAMNISGSQSFLKSLQGRMSSVSGYESDVSALHRLEEWKASLKMIQQHPVAGNGLGSKVIFYSPMYSKDKNRLGFLSDDFYVHNSFVWIAVKTGVIGTALFLLLLITVCRDTLFLLLRSPPGEQRSTLSVLASFLAALTIASIFGPMLTSDLVTPLVAFTMGSIYAVKK